MLSRRGLLGIGGVTIAGPLLRWPAALAGETVEIEMRGRPDGSLVWFDPVGALVRPGGSVRWTNRDPGNAHTSTAYHPANEDHPPRIPEGARPWDSGYLLPDQSFVMIPEVPGVYDYYCVPHEYAGMVGRLVVAEEGARAPVPREASSLPEEARNILPPVEEILRLGRVPARR